MVTISYYSGNRHLQVNHVEANVIQRKYPHWMFSDLCEFYFWQFPMESMEHTSDVIVSNAKGKIVQLRLVPFRPSSDDSSWRRPSWHRSNCLNSLLVAGCEGVSFLSKTEGLGKPLQTINTKRNSSKSPCMSTGHHATINSHLSPIYLHFQYAISAVWHGKTFET